MDTKLGTPEAVVVGQGVIVLKVLLETYSCLLVLVSVGLLISTKGLTGPSTPLKP
jgi:hypothetical protein